MRNQNRTDKRVGLSFVTNRFRPRSSISSIMSSIANRKQAAFCKKLVPNHTLAKEIMVTKKEKKKKKLIQNGTGSNFKFGKGACILQLGGGMRNANVSCRFGTGFRTVAFVTLFHCVQVQIKCFELVVSVDSLTVDNAVILMLIASY